MMWKTWEMKNMRVKFHCLKETHIHVKYMTKIAHRMGEGKWKCTAVRFLNCMWNNIILFEVKLWYVKDGTVAIIGSPKENTKTKRYN